MRCLLSIIIPTYKREKSLLRLLDSLIPEINGQVEVIVIEQVFNHKKKFDAFAKKHHIHFTYIFLPESSTPHAKNVGASIARGKYLLFFDDDVVVEKGILKGYKKAFVKDRNDIVAGKVFTPGHPINPCSKNIGKISYFGKFSDDYTSDIKQEVDTVIGCNAGWRKEVFETVGGFDEQITMNGIREESDLSFRAKEMGYKIFFEPTAAVTHLREATGGGRKSEGRLKWYYNFLSNDTYFFLKYRPTWVVFVILLTRWEWFVRCMFGFGREVSLRSITTPFAGVVYGIRKYKKWKQIQKGLVIGIDAGCLGIQDKRLKVGVYQVAKNLLYELASLDSKNRYILYSFYPIDKKLMQSWGSRFKNILVKPSRGWMKIWLPLRLLKDRPDVFVGLSQSLPLRVPGSSYKSLAILYDLAYEKFPELYRDYARLQKNTNEIAAKADEIIAISEHAKHDFLKKYPIAKGKVDVSYLGVRQSQNINKFKHKYPYFLFVGALKPTKNLPTVLKAFSSFSKSHKKSYELFIVGGDKWFDEKITQELANLPMDVQRRIHFLRVVPDKKLWELYKGATALVMPSIYEGFGLPAAEAMAAGCPVIASTAGALPEIVEDAGLLVKPQDDVALAHHMRKVANDAIFRSKMMKRGLRRAKQYTWVSFAGQFLDIINSL